MGLIFRRAVFDDDVLALDEACFLQALAEGGHQVSGIGERCVPQETNDRHRRLLRARRNRRRDRRAAEQRDEVAAVHVWMAPAWQEITSRAAQKSLAVMCPACSRSPDGLLALMGSANRGLIIRAGSMSR